MRVKESLGLISWAEGTEREAHRIGNQKHVSRRDQSVDTRHWNGFNQAMSGEVPPAEGALELIYGPELLLDQLQDISVLSDHLTS